MANMRLPNQPNEAELTDFLSMVDKIDDVIKGLNSESDDEKLHYMSKADNLMKEVESRKEKQTHPTEEEDADLPKTKTGFSKTSINKDAYKNCDQPQPEPYGRPDEPMDQKAFMAALEADAKERAERRIEREKKAVHLKEQGNEEFKKGNFPSALEYYNKAIEQVKDSTALYTNRAQTRIKLGLFEDAISDCDWALRVSPNCLKAYVQKGHSHLAMKAFDKARESYLEILSIDSGKEEMVKGYISKANRLEQALEEERKASKLIEGGDQSAKSVTEVLKSLKKENQLPIFYAGGLRMLVHLLSDVDSQTLFRTHDGMKLFTEHPIICRCFVSTKESLTTAEKDLISAACDMLTAACRNNAANQEELFTIPDMTSHLLSTLEIPDSQEGRAVKASCVNLLHEISNTDCGRAAIVNNFDMKRLIVMLLMLMMDSYTYAEIAAAVLNNIALHKKLKNVIREEIERQILPTFEKTLTQEKISQSKITLVSSMGINLSMDKSIRCKMVSRTSLWNALCSLLKSCNATGSSSAVDSLLGLISNITTDTQSSTISECGLDAVCTCHTILQTNGMSNLSISRALKVISNVLPLCKDAMSYIEENDRSLLFLKFLQDSGSDLVDIKSSLKCLAVLTQKESICIAIADSKGTSTLLQLLNHKDENVVGNAALCLSHMCSIKMVCAKLTKTNILQKLLVLARDGKDKSLQLNSSILIGKLAQSDARHLQQLRELHGVEILHQCMKHIT